MHTEIKKLLVLQNIDGRLEILSKEHHSRPRLVEAQDIRVQAMQSQIAGVEVDRKALRMETDRAELEVKSRDEKIAESTKKLGQVSSNQEYTAFNQQIRRLQEDRLELEEKLLVLWDRRDNITAKEKELQRGLVEARELLAVDQKLLEQEISEIREEAQKLVKAREEAMAPIDAEILGLYDLLFSRYRERSVVSAEGDVCAGCNMSLSPQTLNELRDDFRVVQCSNCSRILFL